MRDRFVPVQGFLCIDGWAGRTEQAVIVIRETPKRYEIEAVNFTRLGGRNSWLVPGDRCMVPKRSVRINAPAVAKETPR